MSDATRAATERPQPSGTRDLLLRQAERLYAENGIAAVSNRKVAEMTGTANNYAVGYYFRDKQGLIRALVRDHYDEIDQIRKKLLRETPHPRSVRDLVWLIIFPTVLHLDELPTPTWYARFNLHAITDPVWRGVLAEEARATPSTAETWETLLDSIPGVERRILEFRAELVSTLSARANAGYEEQLATGTQSPVSSWRSVGEFVVDAVTGMLTAPQTHPG